MSAAHNDLGIGASAQSNDGTFLSGRPRYKLQGVNREAAIHLRHFIHAFRGTSAMIVLYDQNDEIIFVNMYKSQPYGSRWQSYNAHHAEIFLLNDKSLLDKIVFECGARRHQATTVRIFQSNSPCRQCAPLFVCFHKKLESKVRGLHLEPPVIEVQVGCVWKKGLSETGLKEIFGPAGTQKIRYTWKSMDWFLFYDAFYAWVLRHQQYQHDQHQQGNPLRDMFPSTYSSDDIIAHLYAISESHAIEMTCEEMKKVKGEIDSLSVKWNREFYRGMDLLNTRTRYNIIEQDNAASPFNEGGIDEDLGVPIVVIGN